MRPRLTLLLTLALASNLQAEPLTPGIVPYRPILTLDRQPQTCAPFLQAWTKVFDAPGPLTEATLDLATAFPDGSAIRIAPPDYSGYLSIYGRYVSALFDFDGDGRPEVLYAESSDDSWRRAPVDLYLLDNATRLGDADRLRAVQIMKELRPGRLIPLQDLHLSPPPLKLHSYAPEDTLDLIRLTDGVYTSSLNTSLRAQTSDPSLPLTVEFLRLNPGTDATPVCRVQLLPALTTMDPFVTRSPVLQTTQLLYGGPDGGSCQGSMGWTGTDPRTYMMTAFYRPGWMANRVTTYPATADSSRELRLLTWAVADPTNWRTYQALKADRTAFLTEMTEYFVQSLSFLRPEATKLAAQSYAYLIDETNYGRAQDGYTLTQFALLPNAPLILTPDQSPVEIAAQVLPRSLTLPTKDAGFWQSALLLALFTDQPPTTIAPLLTRLADAVAQSDDYMFRAKTPYPVPPFGPVLAAAITNPDALPLILDHLASPDAPTTDFLKTALMYAAQANNLTAVRTLLDHGANPNLATDSAHTECASPLDRDHRTALMYAAENASAAVINLLLDHGANPQAQDNQRNPVHWYFNHNTTLNAAERNAIAGRLNGR